MARSRFANVLLLLIFATGCHHNTATNQQPPPSLAELALSDIALFFNAPVGQTSRAQTVTLTNTGTASLALPATTLSDTTNFAMTSTCGSNLAPSSSCVLTITFKPQSAADLHVTISIADNTASSPKTIRLNGTTTTAAAAPTTAAAAPAAPRKLHPLPTRSTPFPSLTNPSHRSTPSSTPRRSPST